MSKLARNRTRLGVENLEFRRLLAAVPELAVFFDEPGIGRSAGNDTFDAVIFENRNDGVFATSGDPNEAPIYLGDFDGERINAIRTIGANTFIQTGNFGFTTGSLWRTDGTVAGTEQLISRTPGIDQFSGNDKSLYFATRRGELEQFDLETGETRIAYSQEGFAPINFVATENGVYVHGHQLGENRLLSTQVLYVDSDTDEATLLFETDLFRSRLDQFQLAGDRVFFQNITNSSSSEVWVSDGTTEGTQMLVSVVTGYRRLDVVDFAGSQYFVTQSPNGSTADSNTLWLTDGTTEGTTTVAELTRPAAGTNRYYSPYLIATNSQLYFADQRGRLWTSDGTEEGTHVLLDTTDDNSRPIQALESVDDQLWFVRGDQNNLNTELWTTAGTVEDTRLVWNFDQQRFATHVVDDALILLSGAEVWRYELGTTISGQAWDDLNQNGTQDENEQPLAGVNFQAVNLDGVVVTTATSDAGGHYHLVVENGETYQVTAQIPEGATIVAAGPEDVQVETGASPPIQMDGHREGIDVAISLGDGTGKVRGQTWIDRNRNGHPDIGEVALAGAAIELLNENGGSVGVVQSDENGRYEFDVEGGYRLRAAATDQTIIGPRGEEPLGTQVQRITGLSRVYQAEPNAPLNTLNIGYFPTRIIPPARYDELGSERSNESLLNHLRITEIDTRRNRSFIELTNTSDEQILNLRDVRFLEGVGYDFSDSEIQELFPGERLVVVEDLALFNTQYDTTEILVAGQYLGNLRANELVVLSAPINQEIHIFTLDSERWFPHLDAGFTLAIADESADPSTWSEPSAWRISERQNGSPGLPDQAVLPRDAVVFSEIMTNPNDRNDWVELHNTTDEAIDISGWGLGDDTDGNPFFFRYTIPDGTVIEPDGRVTFNRQEHFRNFGLSSYGETLHLTAADEQGPLGYGHSIEFTGSATDVSFGRLVRDDGRAVMVPMKSPTRGEENSDPATPRVSITEVMSTPAFTQDPFIELQNVTNQTVSTHLRTFGGHRRITFLPQQVVLIVDIDADAFRAKYEIDPDVLILTDPLVHAGGEINLYEIHPGDRATLIEQFDFDWPFPLPQGGASLERIGPDYDFASNPSSWRITDRLGGTPGQVQRRLPGDSNGDGVFDTSDLVLAFQSGAYENLEAVDVSFADGDWNGDGRFDSTDLVLAFQSLDDDQPFG